MIAPLMFTPFLENSFKHGTIKNGVLDIVISFECSNNSIQFDISNTHQKGKSDKVGIGLENIKKRLELLYKNRYDLQIIESEQDYKVQLNLDLKNEQNY